MKMLKCSQFPLVFDTSLLWIHAKDEIVLWRKIHEIVLLLTLDHVETSCRQVIAAVVYWSYLGSSEIAWGSNIALQDILISSLYVRNFHGDTPQKQIWFSFKVWLSYGSTDDLLHIADFENNARNNVCLFWNYSYYFEFFLVTLLHHWNALRFYSST